MTEFEYGDYTIVRTTAQTLDEMRAVVAWMQEHSAVQSENGEAVYSSAQLCVMRGAAYVEVLFEDAW